MRNFTYRSLDEKDNIEAVLRQRKKKINRQQIIAGIIIFIICSLATLYAIDKSFYTEYDAYIHIDINKVRAPYDIYLDSVYVTPGDVVHVGDTLYSYYVLDWLVLEINPNDEPSVLQNSRNLRLQYNDILQKIHVLQVRISELRKQISLESHNISFGLSDNSHKMDLQRELRESEALLAALRSQLAEIAKLLHDAEFGPRGRNRARKGGTQIYENPYSKSDAYAIRYNISNKDGFITNVQAPLGMVFFEKEDIIDMQHLDLKDNNLQIVAYVPVNLTSKIKDNMPAKVYVNDELSFQAHVLMTGVRSEDVPENLRSYFAKANKALIAILTIDEGQIIPFWSATAGLPVKVKIRNLFPWEDEPEVHRVMLYEVGKGLILKDDSNSSTYYDATNLPQEGTPRKKDGSGARKDSKPKSDNTSGASTNREPATDKATAPANKTAPAPQTTATGRHTAAATGAGRYVVVAGAYSDEKSCDIALDNLRREGFDRAGIIPRKSKKWLVYATSADTKEEAVREIIKIKKTHPRYGDAWVYDNEERK